MSWKPKVYRDIEIDGKASLYKLAQTIVSAFDFDFDHAFGFFSDLKDPYSRTGERYELFVDLGEESDPEVGGVERTPIAQAFETVGKKMLFLFDYGDDWLFQVHYIGQAERQPKTRYPRVVGSAGKAPAQYPEEDE